MKIKYAIFFSLSLFSCSPSSKTSSVEGGEQIDIFLVKGLDLECQYNYNFKNSTLTIGCAKYTSKHDGKFEKYCVNTKIVDKLTFYNILKFVKKNGNNVYENRKNKDGFYLRIKLNNSNIIKIYKNYTKEELREINIDLYNLFQLLESQRCL